MLVLIPGPLPPKPVVGKLPEGKLLVGKPLPKLEPNVVFRPKSPLKPEPALKGLELPNTLTLNGELLFEKLVNELLPKSFVPMELIGLPPKPLPGVTPKSLLE